MPPLFGLAKNVDRTTKHALKMRVVRSFTRSGFGGDGNNSNMEIIFHDVEGGRITAMIKKINVKLFQNRIVEGRVYAIRNYYVEANTGRFKTTLSKWKLIFHAKTICIEIGDDFFPNFTLDLRSFNTLVDINKVDETLLFDVIGRLSEVHNPQEKNFKGRCTRLIEIVLEDQEGHRLSCTLWGNYVDEILAYEAGLTTNQPPIVILQLVRAKVYRDVVTLQNSFEATKIITNPDVPEISAFLKGMPKDWSEPTKSISRGTSTITRSDVEDLANGNVVFYPVDYLFTVEEPCTFWICAVIGTFIDDWWYLGCTRCSRKLEENGDGFYCGNCKKDSSSGLYRYKVRLEVLDSTANASLLCWDKEAERLIGRSCHDLRIEFMDSRPDDYIPGDVPEDLAKLIDQTVLFKVKINSNQIHNESSAFSVVRVVKDERLVAMYNKYTIEDDEADFLSQIRKEEGNNNEPNSEDEVTTPMKAIVFKEQAEVDTSIMKQLVFDEEEGIGSNSNRKTRVLTKDGKAVRRSARINEEEDDNGEIQ